MNNRNRRGPNILPWGTPDLTGSGVEMAELMETHWVRLVRYACSQFQTEPVRPIFQSLYRSSLWATESKAFLKSKYITSTCKEFPID